MIAEHRASFKLELAEPPRATKTLLEADAPAWKRDMQLSSLFRPFYRSPNAERDYSTQRADSDSWLQHSFTRLTG